MLPPIDRRTFAFSIRRWGLLALISALVGTGPSFAQGSGQASGASNTTATEAVGGPVRLRQATPTPALSNPANGQSDPRTAEPKAPPRYVPGEFERFVRRQAGSTETRRGSSEAPGTGDATAAGSTAADPGAAGSGAAASSEIRRFGAEVMVSTGLAPDTEVDPLVPPDYVVAPGDELQLSLWGSVDADLQLLVDRTGRITIPRVGSIMVAGVRHADLTDTISRRVAQVFKNYQISVSLGALRGVRVFVTGFVVAPGAYSLSSLSSLTTALSRAGGPSAAGSFRQIELRRANKVESVFDLYNFILKGDRSADRLLQAGDVVHVHPVGAQVAMIGSVNQPAIFELKTGETVDDVLRMSGGFSAVADRTRVAVERLDQRSTLRVSELALPEGLVSTLGNGDVVRVFSAVDAVLPVERQNKRVRVEGEVQRPGDYVLPAASSVADALRAAGGLTAGAHVYGTEFSRESVRLTQQENYERALRDMETDLTRAAATQRVSSADEASSQTARSSANARLLERLRAVKPTGRIVLQLNPDAKELPNLALEDGDRIYIPSLPTSVGVFGSVFNGNNYLYTSNRTVGEYLQLAGGPTRGADEASTFLVRANGVVVSGLQSTGWFGRDTGKLAQTPMQPGDTIFVPEKLDKTTITQDVKDWTQILYQFALGVAAFKSLSN